RLCFCEQCRTLPANFPPVFLLRAYIFIIAYPERKGNAYIYPFDFTSVSRFTTEFACGIFVTPLSHRAPEPDLFDNGCEPLEARAGRVPPVGHAGDGVAEHARARARSAGLRGRFSK